MAEPAPKKHKALDASVQAYIDTNEGTANFWLLAGATGSDDLQQIKLPTCRAFVAFHSKLIRDLPDEEDPEFPVLCDHDTSTLVLFLQACQPNFCGLPEYSAGDIGKLSSPRVGSAGRGDAAALVHGYLMSSVRRPMRLQAKSPTTSTRRHWWIACLISSSSFSRSRTTTTLHSRGRPSSTKPYL